MSDRRGLARIALLARFPARCALFRSARTLAGTSPRAFPAPPGRCAPFASLARLPPEPASLVLRRHRLRAAAVLLACAVGASASPRAVAGALAARCVAVLPHGFGHAAAPVFAQPRVVLARALAAAITLAVAGRRAPHAFVRVAAAPEFAQLLQALAQGFEALLQPGQAFASFGLRSAVAATGAFGASALGREQGGEESQDQQQSLHDGHRSSSGRCKGAGYGAQRPGPTRARTMRPVRWLRWPVGHHGAIPQRLRATASW